MSEPLSVSGTNLTRRFKKGDFALDVPFIEAPAGRTLALLGPSGSGKTTLLQLLGLLDRPDAGEVRLGGERVTPADRAAVLSMAAVFQRPYLFKGSVRANVEYGLSIRGVPRARRGAAISSALARVGLAGYEDRSALQLSGGEAQRVSLARALVVEPQVLLVDEPLASLDPLLKRKLTHDFATILRAEGVTVIYVTHDQDEALVVADSVAIMNRGRIVVHGPTEEIAGLAEDEWTASFLGVEPAAKGIVTASSGGLFQVSIGDASIAVVGEAPVDTAVLISVRPEDVILVESGAGLPPLSARNLLEATILELELYGATVRVTLQVGHERLAASVSRAASADLGLQTGMQVRAMFKASAVRWRRA
ncbi:MAG: ABC transporter ATP-binding protein [Coriobacteriia bacterium]|nr:ABC transporter ATP-binding protein [Coriobacteriia bacterium]